MNSTRKAARFAGLLYVLACLPAPFSLIYLPRKLIVPGDASATANNILASESMFRLGMAGELINAIAFLFAVLALYRPFLLGEAAIVLWLLIRGTRDQPSSDAAA